ncbi:MULTISPECIES: hypothetical protein [Actinomycetes]|uniref:hypothetical protein n=1 Tax=Actinomycetes TaxID=1760 RepID=UPI000F76AC64|nr:hypothetical protein [Streptomyces sp. WAC04770]RST23061.1 hypothetical protein EF908_13115 [Streptomyces sp. WAC04770]
MIILQESDVITVPTGDGPQLALLFSMDSDPLRISAARLVAYSDMLRRQSTVRCARPQDKPLVERVGSLLRSGLADLAPRTRQDAEQYLADLVATVNGDLAGRQRSGAG